MADLERKQAGVEEAEPQAKDALDRGVDAKEDVVLQQALGNDGR